MNILTKQLKEILDKDLPLISNLSNASALLNTLPNINWCGFYLLSGDRLFLGPFQGDVACTIIPLSKGVCGYAARNKQTVVVDDVNQFEGHIACSSLSKSEIVVPIIKNNEVKAVIAELLGPGDICGIEDDVIMDAGLKYPDLIRVGIYNKL